MSPGDTAWVLISAALVLFMTVGLALFYGGLEPQRNMLHMFAMNAVTIALVTLIWAVVGFTLAFGPDAGHGLIGNLHYAGLRNMTGLWPGTHTPKLAYMAFQLMFAVITPALITGAVAGRIRFEAWIAFCVGWSTVVYPVVAHWVFDPSGWIYRLGGRDFAGGAVVHASAGTAAAALVLVLGPRTASARANYRAHSVPLVLIGAGILWFGWFGFNAGSALAAGQLAARAFTVTQLAAASGLLTWAILERRFTGRVTLVGGATGAIAGLATITPAAGYVARMPAIVIGAAAAVACYSAATAFRRVPRFDDAFGVVSVHGIGGVLGMLLVGVFAHATLNPNALTATDGGQLNGLVFGGGALLGHQALAVAATVGFTAALTHVLAVLVRATIGLRVTPAEETTGLGAAYTAATTHLDLDLDLDSAPVGIRSG